MLPGQDTRPDDLVDSLSHCAALHPKIKLKKNQQLCNSCHTGLYFTAGFPREEEETTQKMLQLLLHIIHPSCGALVLKYLEITQADVEKTCKPWPQGHSCCCEETVLTLHHCVAPVCTRRCDMARLFCDFIKEDLLCYVQHHWKLSLAKMCWILDYFIVGLTFFKNPTHVIPSTSSLWELWEV